MAALRYMIVVCILLFYNRCASVYFDEPYAQGVASYNDNDWGNTISHMQSALRDYSIYSSALDKCVQSCRAKELSKPVDYPQDTQLHWYHAVIDLATCFKVCFSDNGVDVEGGINYGLYEEFVTGDPYNYLQMAYHKTGHNDKAAKSASIFVGLNPLNEVAVKNLEYYKTVVGEGVKPAFPAYQKLYQEALQYYVDGDYANLVQKMEKSLEKFFAKLKICRRRCFGPVLHDAPMEYSTGVARHMLSVLECRGQCVETMGNFTRDTDDYFLMSYFRYLHVGYFKLKKYKMAVMTFLTQKRLSTANEEILNNEAIYRNTTSLTRSDWKERADVADVIKELEAEQRLITILRRLLGKDPLLEEQRNMNDDTVDQMLMDQDFINHPVGLTEDLQHQIVERNDTFERIVTDGFLDERQCRKLMQLARIGSEGDGYNRPSPHTQHEKFEGLTAIAAAQAVASGNTTAELANLYLDSSEAVRAYVEKHFNLSTLYFSYTHLVCRTSKDGDNVRDDLSHPVHSDNCVLNVKTGECDKVPPAYTWRDYSAILYLNEDFVGGKFFFAHGTKDLTPEVYVSPKCGRMVGFSAGKENMHGVTAVTRGRRCAVALWFTLDPAHQELSNVEAKKILNSIGS